jgi:predicted short-subunit dehydrogenase-like oxidoreductase (DUF2520 family)
MIKVVILGSGNVATHLTKAFITSKNVEIAQVYTRSNISNKIEKIDYINDLNELKNADVYIISISDDAIANFSKQLNLKNKLVVHTSGSVAMQDLECNARKGVFYPLQTIHKKSKLKFKNVPICLETENKEDYILLEKLAKSISKKIFKIDSEQRKHLHLAAVFVNNFTNHLYKIGNDICTENNIPFEILKPLIKETANKIKYVTPEEAQTGPAKRKDKKTIQKHLNLLQNKQQEIYKLLSNSISNNELTKQRNN